jgi:hypothetical protein
MEQDFHIPLIYNGTQIELAAKLFTYGLGHRFHVVIDGATILFEPDEERNYRALPDRGVNSNAIHVNEELIMLVGRRIQELFSHYCSE